MGKDANFVGLVETKHMPVLEAKIRKWWGREDIE